MSDNVFGKFPLFFRKYKVLLALVLVCVLSGSVGYTIAQSTNSFVISEGIYPSSGSYTLFVNSGVYYIKNAYGVLSYSGSDFDVVMQDMFDDNSGTTIELFVKEGDYIFDTALECDVGLRVRGEGGGVDCNFTYTGEGYALTHNGGRDLIVSDIRVDGGSPFFHIEDGVGSGYYFSFERVTFWTSCDVGIESGASSPFLYVRHCIFRCDEYALHIEHDTDSFIDFNYFYGSSGMSAFILLDAGSANVRIRDNSFMGTADTTPDVIVECGGGLVDANIQITNNKFGGEQLASPDERILFEYSGSGSAIFRESWIDYNYVNCRSDANACDDFISADSSSIVFARVSFSHNIVVSSSGSGYFFDYAGSVSSVDNLAVCNIVQSGYPFLDFNSSATHGFTEVDNLNL